jgi:hypothetical protein
MNMWLKRNKEKEAELPQKLSYSRYYEHDGVLRAYANRAMVLAFLCVPATMVALGFAVYVRMQPPTVIRVDENGQAAVVGQSKPSLSVTQGATAEPTEFEKRAFVRQFLERYLDFTPSNVSRNWADSLNLYRENPLSCLLHRLRSSFLAEQLRFLLSGSGQCEDVSACGSFPKPVCRGGCNADRTCPAHSSLRGLPEHTGVCPRCWLGVYKS